MIPGYDITSCWPVDWQKEIQYLENIYPPIVQWNLPVNFMKFKPTFLSQVAKVLLGESYRNWALRKNGELMGVLIWEEARTWADNLWVGCKPEYKETVLNILLPHAMSILNRKQPQALNYPAGEVEQVLSRYGFQKHITLIWMELVESETKQFSYTCKYMKRHLKKKPDPEYFLVRLFFSKFLMNLLLVCVFDQQPGKIQKFNPFFFKEMQGHVI